MLATRFALAASFFSAVADRFGGWGALGTGEVAWGSFSEFTEYTGVLLWFFPEAVVAVFAWMATALEVLFAIALIGGFHWRRTAAASGVLLGLFAVSMTLATGPEGPFSYSVWTASAAAFLLSSQALPDDSDV